ncbi:MAG: PQQ-binding-like beta-propeller repeat protein [Planctomycetota bacterium]
MKLRQMVGKWVFCLVLGPGLGIFWSACGGAGELSDWPQWRGWKRDGVSSETGLLKKWPEGGPKLLWSVDGLGKGYSTVAVANGLVFTTGLVDKEGILFAFDLEGHPKWKKSYGPGWTGSRDGVRTTPTVDGDSVYVMSGYGRVVCFDTKTGGRRWAVDTQSRFGGENINWGISESVLIEGQKVICTPGGQDATVVALDKQTGKTIWRSKGLSDRSAYCSAILVERGDKRLVVTITDKSIVGIDAGDGTVLWQHPNKLHKGEPREVNPNSPVYHDGCIYVTSRWIGATMLRLSEDGTRVKKVRDDERFDPHHGGFVVVHGFIYGANTKGEKWMCLEWATGKITYEHKWLGKGSVTYAEGMLYCYEEKKGTVGLVKASPAGFEVVSSFLVSKGTDEHWAHPVVCGGRLYIRHGDALMAYDVKGSGYGIRR